MSGSFTAILLQFWFWDLLPIAFTRASICPTRFTLHDANPMCRHYGVPEYFRVGQWPDWPDGLWPITLLSYGSFPAADEVSIRKRSGGEMRG